MTLSPLPLRTSEYFLWCRAALMKRINHSKDIITIYFNMLRLFYFQVAARSPGALRWRQVASTFWWKEGYWRGGWSGGECVMTPPICQLISTCQSLTLLIFPDLFKIQWPGTLWMVDGKGPHDEGRCEYCSKLCWILLFASVIVVLQHIFFFFSVLCDRICSLECLLQWDSNVWTPASSQP